MIGGGLGERLGAGLARPDRGGGERAHVLPRAARVPARRARRSRRRDRREPARVTVAIVTGAGRGIGAAIARRLHAEGWTVVARRHRRRGGLARSPASSGATPSRSRWTCATPSRGRDAVAAAHEAGDLGALVNCAARTDVRDLFAIEPEEWDDVLATNLRGPFLGIRAVGPHLRDRGAGRIVNIASDSAFRGRGVTGAHYATSKAGLHRAHAPRGCDPRAGGRHGQRGRARHDRRRDGPRAGR